MNKIKDFIRKITPASIWILAFLIAGAIAGAYLVIGTLLLNFALGTSITVWQFLAANVLASLVRAVYSYVTKIKVE